MNQRRGLAEIARKLRTGVVAADVLARRRVRAGGAIIFAYHDIREPPFSTDYTVSPGRFRRQLLAAKKWGLQFVHLEALIDALAAGESVDGLAAVVFDDCLVGVHRNAAPILADLAVPATLFVVSDALGSSPPWWPGSDRVMTRGELVELVDEGFQVGSHSRTHPSLFGLTRKLLTEETTGSRKLVEDLAQKSVDLFAYPFGHHDPAARQAVREAGYRAGFTFLNGRITTALDPFRLPRLNMHEGLRHVRLAGLVARPPAAWPDTQFDAVAHGEPA